MEYCPFVNVYSGNHLTPRFSLGGSISQWTAMLLMMNIAPTADPSARFLKSVVFYGCLSNCWDQIPRTCHAFTRLFTSNTPWYFLDFASVQCGFSSIKISGFLITFLFEKRLFLIDVYSQIEDSSLTLGVRDLRVLVLSPLCSVIDIWPYVVLRDLTLKSKI